MEARRGAVASHVGLDALRHPLAVGQDVLGLHAVASAPDPLGGLHLERYRRGVPMTDEVSLGLKSVIPFVLQLQVVFDDDVRV